MLNHTMLTQYINCVVGPVNFNELTSGSAYNIIVIMKCNYAQISTLHRIITSYAYYSVCK